MSFPCQAAPGDSKPKLPTARSVPLDRCTTPSTHSRDQSRVSGDEWFGGPWHRGQGIWTKRVVITSLGVPPQLKVSHMGVHGTKERRPVPVGCKVCVFLLKRGSNCEVSQLSEHADIKTSSFNSTGHLHLQDSEILGLQHLHRLHPSIYYMLIYFMFHV